MKKYLWIIAIIFLTGCSTTNTTENNNESPKEPLEGSSTVVPYNLGVAHYTGRGMPQDYKEAVKWFSIAAEQGDANGQTNLGVMYEEGRGVGKDD
jgi:hypothetical protein